MLAGHSSAWMEIGKTLNALGYGSSGFTFDFSGFAVPNVDQIKKDAEVALNDNIAAAQQTTMMDPIAQAQQVSSPAVVDTGLARTPEGEMIDPETGATAKKGGGLKNIIGERNPIAVAAEKNNPTLDLDIEGSGGTQARQSTGIGTLDYTPAAVAPPLPEVKDPAKALSEVTRRQGEFERKTIRPFEQALIRQLEEGGEELIAQAPLDVSVQATKAEGIAKRNIIRYGFSETGATRQARNTAQSLARTVAVTDAVNNARIDQDSSNAALLNVLVGAGGTVNQLGLSALSGAAGMQQQRTNAFRNAQANAKAQKYGFIGSLFGMI